MNTAILIRPDPQTVELAACYERIAQLEAVLVEARLQIEYLHEKFQPTGSGETILALINSSLDPFMMESV